MFSLMFKSTPGTDIWSIDILCKLNCSKVVPFKNAFLTVLEGSNTTLFQRGGEGREAGLMMTDLNLRVYNYEGA